MCFRVEFFYLSSFLLLLFIFFFFLLIRRPPRSTLFPYTTLSRSVDTLFALGDTLLFRPGYLDAAGSHLSAADSAAIRPSYQLVSAGLAVRLDPSSGKISAKANGTDTVQAMVDTSAIRLVVRVRQRAAKLSVSPSPSDTLRALQATRQFSVLAWDSKDSLIAQPAVTWKSR